MSQKLDSQYLASKLNTLNIDQSYIFNQIQLNTKLQVCIPTGGGKNYIMMVDILKRVITSKEQIFAISSHRLMLNNQHMSDMFNLFSPMIGKIGLFLLVVLNMILQN